MSITIHRGSILDSKAEAIVNAANGHLRHGGGLARVIDQAAQGLGATAMTLDGEPNEYVEPYKSIRQYQIDHRDAPLIATGNVHVTSAGALPFKGIIHAVGPIWNGGGFCEAQLLSDAYNYAFSAAAKRGWASIALPAISAGIFGYPPEKVARIAVSEARVWDDVLDIEFWPFGHEELFEAELAR